MFLVSYLSISSVAWALTGPELEQLWKSETESFDLATLPTPQLLDAHFDKMSAGEVVKLRLDEHPVDRAIGVSFCAEPPDALWIAIQDDRHDTIVSGLHELHLPGSTAARKLLYQRLDLPFPFHDRHWALVLENSSELHPGLWERTWTLDPRGASVLEDLPAEWVADAAGAIPVSVNDGGWWLLPDPQGTLMVYQVRTVVGGAIPAELVIRYAMATLDEMLEHVCERAAEIPGHYDASHTVLEGPDGTPLLPWPRQGL